MIKILSLGVGLSIGLVLLAKVSFELNYDDFYPESDRIYRIEEKIKMTGDPKEYPQVSGGVAPGMKVEIPEVEAATRFTWIYEGVFYSAEKNRYTGTFILADSCIFDVLPRPMIAGNAKEILSRPMYALVSASIAKKMGGDVVGKEIEMDSYPGRIITIGGIFEDVPENSHYRYDVILSLPSITKFTSWWDGSLNWYGNDRYKAYVRLKSGTDPAGLAPAIRQMQEKYQDQEKLREAGVDLTYILRPLTRLHSDSPEVRRMTLLLSALAFALIFTAIMNYILIVISSLVERTKEVAVYKCYGAQRGDITKRMFHETFFHLALSLMLALLIGLLFRGTIRQILGTSLGALFSFRSVLYLSAVCAVVFLVAAVIPSHLFSNIPVSAAFRTFKKSRRTWKLALLFVQFAATAFMVILLVIVGRQYRVMIDDDPGYTYRNVLYAGISGVPSLETGVAEDRISQLPQVASVARSSCLPIDGASGNNVSLPGDGKDLFNMADLYFINENYLSLMEIPVVEGKGFDRESGETTDMIVSRSFADRMKTLAGWDDGVVGKDVTVSEHGLSRIVGVYPDIRVGSISDQDKRPSAMFYSSKRPRTYILIKLTEMNGENIRQVYDMLKSSMPEKDIVLTPYSDGMVKLYENERRFRNTVLIGGMITLLITLIGLIGYINNEMVRRTSEIAVRKINGATRSDILRLFAADILWIALPALVFGGFAAYFAANKWMEDFSEKASLPLWLFIGCALGVLAVSQLTVLLNCLKIANRNPVESLKTN